MTPTRRTFVAQTLTAAVALAQGALSPARCAEPTVSRSTGKVRLIIETDAGGDPDDEQSLVRLLVYANEFDLEGIIANRPVARTPENRNPIRDGLGIVRAMIRAYGQCYSNLRQHDVAFPTADELLRKTVAGYDDIDDGVDLIIRAVDAPDPRPVWFSNWGTDRGSAESCLMRALDRVLRERGPAGYAAFKQRLRLSSADKFGDHSTRIGPPFPLWVDTWRPPLEGKRWYHQFSTITAKAGGFDLERDVRTGHGPLGMLYPTNTNRPQKEGDTMSFLYLLPIGLNDPDQPTWGSWGGRYGLSGEHPEGNYFWANQVDRWNGTTHRDNTLARWADALQNDFRSRLDWCVQPRAAANHRPIAVVNGDTRGGIIQLAAVSGETVKLSAVGSRDPDRRRLSARWYTYPEAGTCSENVVLSRTDGMTTSFVAPRVRERSTLHVIFELTNDGEPPLTAYRRVIVTIAPV